MLLCVLVASAPAVAQGPFPGPVLRDRPKGGFGSRATPTPTATEAPTATATEAPTASPTATATPRRRHRDTELARTGADPLRLALAGLTLLGFGFSLRFRVALADARRLD